MSIKFTNSIHLGGGGGKTSQTESQTPLVEMSTSTATLESGKFYKWGEVTSLNISFATPQIGELPIYAFKFTSGETATSLTINDDVTWITGGTTLEKNKTYDINITDGFFFFGGG